MSDRPLQMGARELTSHRMTQTVSLLSRLNSAVDCRVIENLRRPVEHVQRAHITLLSSDRRPVLEIAKRGRHQPSGGTALDVQAWHLVERVEGEAVGLFCPGGADCFIGRQATESFESPTEIVDVDEVGEMLPELIVCFVVVASDCCFFQRPVHQLDLTYASFSSQLCWPEPQAGSAVGPGVLWLGQPMIDVIDGAAPVEASTRRIKKGQQRDAVTGKVEAPPFEPRPLPTDRRGFVRIRYRS